MVIAEIKSWLASSRDYQQGLSILKKHSNTPLLKMLDTGEDTINRNKLAQLLISLVSKHEAENPVVKTVELAEERKAIVEANNNSNKSEGVNDAPVYPAKLLRLINERKSLYAEVNHLKSKTVACPEGDGLKELAFEILNRWNRIDEIWSIQDNFNLTGEMPADPAEILAQKYSDPVFLKKSQINLRSNLSKIATKIKNAKGDKARIALLTEREENFKRELEAVNDKLEEYEKKSI